MSVLTCFKANDIRGRLGEDMDESIVYRIGRASAGILGPGLFVTGRDNRNSSETLQAALIDGLRDGGADVTDIGLCGTEEVYFATDHFDACAGIMVTASHNPADYNGLKLVGPGAAPLSLQTGLRAIHDLAASETFATAAPRGSLRHDHPRPDYVTRVLSCVDIAALTPLRVLINAGHGAAGPTFDAIAKRLVTCGAPLEFVRIHHAPDGDFPAGIPNPLLPENRLVTASAVQTEGADFAVAWDGDFDRCFFFDETGCFIEGEYIVGLLAAATLKQHPGATIVHDPRVVWNARSIIAQNGGVALATVTGHTRIKARMRHSDAAYGGEMSAHHYFRDFMHCDSGMIPWILVAGLIGQSGRPLSALVSDMRRNFPSSGELNFKVKDPQTTMDRVAEAFAHETTSFDRFDGVSLEFPEWRFNLRASNTEPLLRLNVETRGNRPLLQQKTALLSALIGDAAR